MYQQFFGLRERPFDLTPNPRFLFMTAGHREALSTIEYGIAGRKGITLLVGPAGTGKTTLVHLALGRQKARQTATALFLKNPMLTRDEFLQFLATGFGLSSAASRSKTHLLRELEAMLEQRLAAGIVTALIVDEAQTMSDVLLDELRLLANIETTTEKLFPVVLVGQPELADRLNEQPMQQLKQRVALRARLAPLTADETVDYITERVRVAGGDISTIFSAEAIAAIFRCSGGIPRTISVVCDNALVSGFALDQRPVGRNVILEVARDFDLLGPRKGGALLATTTPSLPAPPAASPLVKAVAVEAPPTSLILTHPAVTISPQLATLGLSSRFEEPPVVDVAPPRRGFRSLFARMATR
jgi:general secretion pathway protein A